MRYHVVSAFPLAMALAAGPGRAATCESLAKQALANTTITMAAAVPAGDFTPPQGQPMRGLPAFCRVAGVIKPSDDSHIEFEVWMPAAGWNGKFQGVGNGGYAGSIGWGSMAAALRNGYASASTDTGHRGGATEATWAQGHPEKVIDFGYRAIHETTEKAKALVAAFYGDGPKRSYFSSCSNGGREALMEAQRYPADFDGIIAGAPANYWTHLLVGSLWNAQALLMKPGSYIPASKLPAIEAAALAKCDASDGVKDGVIDNPATCHFDASELLCKGEESDTCLTAAQVTALGKIYTGPLNSRRQSVFPGYSPGGETGPGGWAAWTTGPAPEKSLGFAYGTQFFANMLYQKADWDYHTFNVDREVAAADGRLASILNSTDPDLKRFQARGGKLILYHGWSDAAIPPLNTIDYYQSVIAKMGPQPVEQFVRLYMVPGMQHCGGGPGPNSFGQATAAQGDAQHDMARALEHWVEDGVAPQAIIATRAKTADAPARSKPLCPYPQLAHWNGKGDTNDAANYVCGK